MLVVGDGLNYFSFKKGIADDPETSFSHQFPVISQ